MPKKKYVEVELDLSRSTLWKLFNMAHNKDITLNKLVEQILKEHLDSVKK